MNGKFGKKMKLSIITINRNNAEGLRKTIESVVSQTYTDFEYIIIDGASTDESIEIIKQHADKISYWVSEPDKGIYNAMNKGILKATGQYCLFINSGDWLYNETVIGEALSINFCEDIVYGSIINIYGKDIVTEEYPDEQNIDFDWFLHSTIPHGSSFIKRDLFTSIGLYSEDYRIVSDWEFFLVAICKYNCSLKKVKIPIYYFDNNGISSEECSEKLIRTERELTLQKHFPKIINGYTELLKQKSDFDIYRASYSFKIYKRICKFKK